MRRLTAILCAIAMAYGAAHAVPAKPGAHTFTQSDGTQITVNMIGDEFHHSFITSDGLTVMRAENGDFFYRTADGMTSVRAHNVADRDQAEQIWLSAESSKLTLSAIQSASARKKVAARNVAVKETQVPCTGSPKIPILLIQYSDKKMANTKEALQAQYSSGSKSVYQYFVDQSWGKYTPEFDLFGIYTLSGTRSSYGANDSSGNDKYVAKMVGEAVDAAAAEGVINWKDYDNDGDGYCDVVIVVYAGVGEAQAYDVVPSSIWPCQWSLSSGAQYSDGTGARTYNSTKIDKFAVFNETYGSSDTGTTLDGIGTFCHEFSHCLGLPDFYDTNYTGKYFGMGNWSLLDGGCYCDDGFTPCGYTAYEKNFMGWMPLGNPVENTQYTIKNITDSTTVAYKVQNASDKNEYYILENRQNVGWDKYLPSKGLQVTHVTYSASAWEGNTVNDYATQRMTIIPADGSLLMSGGYASETGMKGDLYPYNGNNELTNSSTPAAKVYTGTYMNKPITAITQNTDGTMSFWYMKAEKQYVNPVLNEASDIDSTSFTASWTPGEDVTSYTLYVNNQDKLPTYSILNSSSFTSGLPTGWTKSSTGTFTETGYYRLGTSKATGYVTSPSVDVTDAEGKCTVKVQAKSYGNDTGVNMVVTVLNSSGTTVGSKTFTLTSNDETYVALISGAGAGSTIKIANAATSKRVMLSQVDIYSGDATDAGDAAAPLKAAATETGDADTRTIASITDTCYTVKGLTANATYTFKVKAIFNDGTEGNWSEVKTVKLAGTTALKGDVNGDGVVDTTDLSTLMGIILSNGLATDYPRADVNGDGSVDTTDISALMAIILGA